MNDNEGYVICVQCSLGECYVSDRDGVTSKIKAAYIYHDDIYVKSELNRIIEEYKNIKDHFFSDKTKLSIKKVEINITQK